jgi:hypothetical protein
VLAQEVGGLGQAADAGLAELLDDDSGTLNFINGDYTLSARIYDTAGHMTVTSVPVHIQN